MKKVFLFIIVAVSILISSCNVNSSNKSQSSEEERSTKTMEQVEYIKADVYETESRFPIKVTLIGHGSIMLDFNGGTIVHVDPYSKIADYTRLPKADIILLTHEHSDHLDTTAINTIKKADTHFIVSKVCKEILGYGYVLNNGDSCVKDNLDFKAVPAYNIVNKKPDGEAYHPIGRGNGYVITSSGKNIYIAGDTENIPEMESLKGTIDIAFLPKNLPYTMTDEMFVDAAKTLQPKYLYPYHFSEFDQEKIEKELAGLNIKLIVCPMSNK